MASTCSRLRSLVLVQFSIKAYAQAWQGDIDRHRTLKQKKYSSYTAYSLTRVSNPNIAIPEVRPVGKGRSTFEHQNLVALCQTAYARVKEMSKTTPSFRASLRGRKRQSITIEVFPDAGTARLLSALCTLRVPLL